MKQVRGRALTGIGGLTVEPDPARTCRGRVVDGLDHLIVSQRLVTKLGAAARAFVNAELCDHSCPLAAKLGSHEACRLAVDLAELAPPAVTATPDPVTTYIRALREAAHAVYYCRRIAHASGQCWFSPEGSDVQRCGRVLNIAHRIG